MILKFMKSVLDLVRYTTAGILIVLLLPLSFCVFTLLGLSEALSNGYKECYRLMYEFAKLILGSSKVKTVVLKEGQEYDEVFGAYYPNREVSDRE